MIRPQAILVLLLVVVVVSLGTATVARDAGFGGNGNSERTSVVATPLASATVRTTVSPQRTEPTGQPQPTPTRRPDPTPEPTERPPDPPIAESGEAVVVERGTSGRREVALTFDAGEGRGYTEEVLDLLAAEGVTATFGVTGAWAEANPDLMRRIVAEGHMVINHTYDHSSFTGRSTGTEPLTSEQRRAQLERTERVIAELTGYETAPYFRFPYGDYDAGALVDVGNAGYPYTIRWTCDSLAWRGVSAAEIVQKCGIDEAEPGAIILLHVDPIADYEALPGLIATLRGQGYELVTVDQLLQP